MGMLFNPLAWDFAGWSQKIRDFMEFLGVLAIVWAKIVLVASIVANRLPQYETMAEGRWSRFYKRFVVPTIAFCALNWRRRIASLDWKLGYKDCPQCPHCGAEKEVQQ